MESELVFFKASENLEKILEEHPNYTKIYFKKEIVDGKTYISLSKNSGDALYLVSNADHSNIKNYLRPRSRSEPIEKRSEPQEQSVVAEPSKKPKQQNLFNFFTKK